MKYDWGYIEQEGVDQWIILDVRTSRSRLLKFPLLLTNSIIFYHGDKIFYMHEQLVTHRTGAQP